MILYFLINKLLPKKLQSYFKHQNYHYKANLKIKSHPFK